MTLKKTCCILLMACLLTACRQTDLSALLKPVVEGLSVHADYSLADITFRLSPDGNVTVCNVECTQEGTTVRTVPAERDGDGGYRCRLWIPHLFYRCHVRGIGDACSVHLACRLDLL